MIGPSGEILIVFHFTINFFMFMGEERRPINTTSI
jgi:hypothetical protein